MDDVAHSQRVINGLKEKNKLLTRSPTEENADLMASNKDLRKQNTDLRNAMAKLREGTRQEREALAHERREIRALPNLATQALRQAELAFFQLGDYLALIPEDVPAVASTKPRLEGRDWQLANDIQGSVQGKKPVKGDLTPDGKRFRDLEID